MEKQGFSTDEWSEKLTTYSLASVARKKKIFYSHYLGDFGSCGFLVPRAMLQVLVHWLVIRF